MLQKLRDSVNVKRYVDYVKGLEDSAKPVAEAIHSFVKERWGRKLLLVYQGLGKLPSSIIYYFTLTLNSDQEVLFEEALTATHYVLPYREGYVSILFSTNPSSQSTINFTQTARVLQQDALIITLNPVDEGIKNTYRGHNVVFIDSNHDIEASLLMSIASYYASTKLYEKMLGFRGVRLYKHSIEGLSVIVEEFVSIHMNTLERILIDKPSVVYSTKMLEPPVLFLTKVMDSLGIRMIHRPLDEASVEHKALIVATSVDEHVVKQVKFKYSLAKLDVIDLVLNVDPLEAQIYLPLLFYYFIFSLKR